MTKPAHHVLSNVVLCDQVLRLDNGRDVLVGVIGDDIVVPMFPAAIRVSVWFELRTTGPGRVPLKVRITTPADRPPIELDVPVDFRRRGSVAFTLPNAELPLATPGEIKVEARFGDKAPWTVVQTKMVIKQEQAPAPGPSPTAASSQAKPNRKTRRKQAATAPNPPAANDRTER
jgi:hypothetical protein